MDAFELSGPVILFLMMALIGTELTPADFRRIARYPRAVWVGTLGQWLLLPAMSAALLLAFRPGPDLAAGMILIAAVPGGGISNVFAYLAGANVALSVTLTALSSLGAVLVIPVVTSLGFEAFVGEAAVAEVPVLPMIGQLAALVIVPIGLGMALRAQRPDLPERAGPWLRRGVLVAIVVLFAAGMAGDDNDLAADVVAGAPLGLAWAVAAMAIGWTTAAALRLDGPERFTFLIEFSVRNVALAAILALSEFQRPAWAVFGGAYAMTGYPVVILAAFAFRRLRRSAG